MEMAAIERLIDAWIDRCTSFTWSRNDHWDTRMDTSFLLVPAEAEVRQFHPAQSAREI